MTYYGISDEIAAAAYTAQKQKQRRCAATTRRGNACPIPATAGKAYCHVHDPDGTYQRQRRERR